MATSFYPFVDFKMVQTYKPLERALQWKVDPVFRDLAPFNFTVEVSESSDFSTLLYSLAAGNGFYVTDATQQRQSEMIDLLYRVKLTTGSQKTFYSAPLIYFAKGEKRSLFLKAKEIIRKEFVRYRYTGQQGWLLKRKNYGEQDPDNIDPITGVPLTDNRTDFGTGIKGGYYKPLLVSYSREELQSSSQLNEQGFGTTTSELQKHRFVGFPIMEPYDILVTDSNHRYRYSKVSSTFMPGTDLIILQLCEATLLPPTDSIYSIEV